MRYRKSISLCTGIKINLSKSGVSWTFGGKGLSVNVGPKGTYLNTGIPGTGLYDRKKISDPRKKSKKASIQNKSAALLNQNGDIKLKMDENRQIDFFYADGTKITDQTYIASIKRTAEYKQIKQRMLSEYDAKMNEMISETSLSLEKIIHINLHAETVKTMQELNQALNELQPQKYVRKEFQVEKPDREMIRKLLIHESENSIHGKIGKKHRVKKFVNTHFEQVYQNAFAEWENKKQQFDAQEDRFEKNQNVIFQKNYQYMISLYSKAFSGDHDSICEIIDGIIKDIELPVDFSVQYELYSDGILFVDLDLPEIEDLPEEKFVKLKSGTVKRKNKTQTELKQDYTKCVFGMALYFASLFFNITPFLDIICLSGYTQRRNKAGDSEDVYVYSVVFDRKRIQHENLTGNDPMSICMKFKNRCNMTTTFLLKRIIPFSIDDLQE